MTVLAMATKKLAYFYLDAFEAQLLYRSNSGQYLYEKNEISIRVVIAV